jgi:hypothetical protein
VHDFLGEAARSPSSAARSRVSLWSASKAGPSRRSAHLLGRHHDGREEALGHRVLEGGGALLALQQELHAAESALDLADAAMTPIE